MRVEIRQVVKDKFEEEIMKNPEGTTGHPVTSADLDRAKTEIMEEVQAHNQKASAEANYKSLKDQAFARRLNIIIFGIADSNSVEEDTRVAQDFFKDRMGLNGVRIHYTYRLGSTQGTANTTRPLVVKFATIQDKWLVWNNKSRILYDQNNPVRIREDIPRKLREDSRILQRIAKAAHSTGMGEAKVKDYKVTVNGNKYGMQNIKDLPRELQPAAVYTPRSHNAVVFFTKNSPLSNHHHAPFVLDGKSFVCVEQYLAYSKALLAQNEASAKRALDVKEPAEHKAILNSLRNEVQEAWEKQAPQVILPAIRAKFRQNDHLADFLIETYPLSIGEASRNQMWGIGMQLEHQDVMDINKWDHRGNLLGYTLEQVREELMRTVLDSPPTRVINPPNRD